MVLDPTVHVGVLDHQSETALPGLFDRRREFFITDDLDGDPEPFTPRSKDRQGLRADPGGDDKDLLFNLSVRSGRFRRGGQAHSHCLGRGGGFVQQGSVGDGQTGEGGYDRLVVQEGF